MIMMYQSQPIEAIGQRK